MSGHPAIMEEGTVKGSMAAGACETPEVEVPEKPRRRRFTADYKLAVLREAEQLIASSPMTNPASASNP